MGIVLLWAIPGRRPEKSDIYLQMAADFLRG
jgi:hypothetical protein